MLALEEKKHKYYNEFYSKIGNGTGSGSGFQCLQLDHLLKCKLNRCSMPNDYIFTNMN